VLREPGAQILSTYTYFRNNWAAIPAEMSFADYLDAVRDGTHLFDNNELAHNSLNQARYLPWLLRWRERLEDARMKVITFDALRRDPRTFMTDLAEWCGISAAFFDDYGFPAENESYAPRLRGLQRLNIALRDRLPKGRLYDATRRMYRRLNTREPDRGEVDPAVMARLRADFEADNRVLAETFGLDLSSWKV
jgi:hypothetical protein